MKAGEEQTLLECDNNIAMYYKLIKEKGRCDHYEELMDKSLDRRLQLINRELEVVH